jgi:hypothetical protein
MSFLDRFGKKPLDPAFREICDSLDKGHVFRREELDKMKADPSYFPAEETMVKLYSCRIVARQSARHFVDRATGTPIGYYEMMDPVLGEVRAGMKRGLHPVLAALAAAAETDPEGRMPAMLDLAAAVDVIEFGMIRQLAGEDHASALAELWRQDRFDEADALVQSLLRRAAGSEQA